MKPQRPNYAKGNPKKSTSICDFTSQAKQLNSNSQAQGSQQGPDSPSLRAAAGEGILDQACDSSGEEGEAGEAGEQEFVDEEMFAMAEETFRITESTEREEREEDEVLEEELEEDDVVDEEDFMADEEAGFAMEEEEGEEGSPSQQTIPSTVQHPPGRTSCNGVLMEVQGQLRGPRGPLPRCMHAPPFTSAPFAPQPPEWGCVLRPSKGRGSAGSGVMRGYLPRRREGLGTQHRCPLAAGCKPPHVL